MRTIEFPQITNGKVYLVGGSVRDLIMKRPMKDADYVLVGATVEQAKSDLKDWEFVGDSFPVFKKNINGRLTDIALARTERKVSSGHKGFAVDFSESITIEQDLSRRDLTINSIAMDQNGTFVDPFNGTSDIEKRILRHTSAAFSEDPLRVYRLARFAAQLGFFVNQQTINFCKKLSGELSNLSRDRVREEFIKATQGKFPWRFVDILTLSDCQDVHFGPASSDAKTLSRLIMVSAPWYFIAAEIMTCFNADELIEFNNKVGLTNEIDKALRVIRAIKEIAHSHTLTMSWINLLRSSRRANIDPKQMKSLISIYLTGEEIGIYQDVKEIFNNVKADMFPGVTGAQLGRMIDNKIQEGIEGVLGRIQHKLV